MSAAQTETMAMGKAINAALADSLEEDPSIILSGEDIGQLGGVFRVTDGLQDRFGKDRVLDSPLAESAIVGTAVGMTYAGLRPVVEIQFDGFIYPAFDQIVAQVAKLQYRTGGLHRMPITIRVPFGGHIGSVEHHSESPEAYFAHTAGASSRDGVEPAGGLLDPARSDQERRPRAVLRAQGQVLVEGRGRPHRRAGPRDCRCSAVRP